jgi:beta-barrel assembly-enhancing protease
MFIKIIILLILIINAAIANNKLPNLGNEAQLTISPKEEIIIGKVLLHQLQQQSLIFQDPMSTAYINHLGNTLLANTDQIDLNKFNFFIINIGNEINAFAFFGGNVGFFPELIIMTKTESELAAILAHEISHLTQKHHSRQLLQQKKLMPLTIAGTIAASTINPHLAALVLGGHLQQMLNFSREHEQEADRIGMQVLTKSGFDPEAMPNIFQRFSQFNTYNQKIPEYLLTHPMFESRISDAMARTLSNKYKQFKDHLDYYLIKARINAYFNANKNNLLAKIETQLKNHRYNNYTALRYEQALILHQLHKNQQAIQILQELAFINPENIIIQLSLAEIQININKLANLIQLYPDYLPLILSYAEALLNNKEPLAAKKLLEHYNKDHIVELIEEPKIYELLTACFQQLNNPTEGLITQAKLLIITNYMKAANQKLELAAKTASINQANRIKILQTELKDFF